METIWILKKCPLHSYMYIYIWLYVSNWDILWTFYGHFGIKTMNRCRKWRLKIDRMELSWTGGTPKSSIFIGFSMKSTIYFWDSPIFGNHHIICWMVLLGTPLLGLWKIPMNFGTPPCSFSPNIWSLRSGRGGPRSWSLGPGLGRGP